ATQAPMASASSHGSHPARPPTANQPPTGATAIASPRKSCVQVVNRLASEYHHTMARARGERAAHKGLRRQAAKTNTAEATPQNRVASRELMTPRGSSRPEVLGLRASNRASTSRLKPMAADRAETIATTIQKTADQVIGACRPASSAPAKAKGSAKTEWLKRTNDR